MEKNWLIRTKSLHILGPVSKAKVIELLDNKSINEDDELCSGNGYWFFVKETALLEKYIFNDETQTFNPVSEAATVLNQDYIVDEEVQDVDDVTVIGMKNPLEIINAQGEILNLEKPNLEIAEEDELVESSDLDLKKNTENTLKDRRDLETSQIEEIPDMKKKSEIKKKNISSNFLYTLVIIIITCLLIALYFRKHILTNFVSQINIEFISNANAQDNFYQKKN